MFFIEFPFETYDEENTISFTYDELDEYENNIIRDVANYIEFEYVENSWRDWRSDLVNKLCEVYGVDRYKS